MIKVSVIVPVYNVEPYLRKCLLSLVNQTLKEIEIIIVNDGATDNSKDIIDEFQSKYSNIKSFTKENGGLSDARNYGFEYCIGEYVGFIDSDDFVEDTMFEILYKKAKEEDSDIVECNFKHFYLRDGSVDTEIGEKIYDKQKMLMHGRSVVWNKIYKRDWLEKLDIKFPKGLIYEDVQYYLYLLPFVRKYSYVDEALIYYVQRDDSINNFSTLKTLDILKILDNILCFYKENNLYEEYKDALEYFYARILLCSSFSRISRIKDKKQRKYAYGENIKLLYQRFPNWKKNKYLKEDKSKKGIYMKTINSLTYGFYSFIFSATFKLKVFIRGGAWIIWN